MLQTSTAGKPAYICVSRRYVPQSHRGLSGTRSKKWGHQGATAVWTRAEYRRLFVPRSPGQPPPLDIARPAVETVLPTPSPPRLSTYPSKPMMLKMASSRPLRATVPISRNLDQGVPNGRIYLPLGFRELFQNPSSRALLLLPSFSRRSRRTCCHHNTN